MKHLFALILVTSPLLADTYQSKNYSHLIGMQGFSDSLLQMHFKLYEGYVKNTNELLDKLQKLSDSNQGSSPEYAGLKRRFGWEFDGMRLHELYFENLGGSGSIDQKTSLYQALITQFGSFERWRKDFIATGSMRGIGWAVLYFDPQLGKLINCWIGEHDLGHLATGQPLLIMDVFEHAYMPQYGLDRAKYIEAFFANIDWKRVSSRYSK